MYEGCKPTRAKQLDNKLSRVSIFRLSILLHVCFYICLPDYLQQPIGRFVEPAACGAISGSARVDLHHPGRCRLLGINKHTELRPHRTTGVRESCSDSHHASQTDLGLLHVHVSTGTCVRVSVCSTSTTSTSAPRTVLGRAWMHICSSTSYQQAIRLCRATRAVKRAIQITSIYSDIMTRRLLYSTRRRSS
jgi:hypothetical protein